MEQHTGGHWLDTGDGLQSLTAVSGRAVERAALTAYRKYLDHRPTCVQCQTSLFICDTAKTLWEAYRAFGD